MRKPRWISSGIAYTPCGVPIAASIAVDGDDAVPFSSAAGGSFFTASKRAGVFTDNVVLISWQGEYWLVGFRLLISKS